jgi:hypothetical protein
VPEAAQSHVLQILCLNAHAVLKRRLVTDAT